MYTYARTIDGGIHDEQAFTTVFLCTSGSSLVNAIGLDATSAVCSRAMCRPNTKKARVILSVEPMHWLLALGHCDPVVSCQKKVEG